jgi:hypothetical protein
LIGNVTRQVARYRKADAGMQTTDERIDPDDFA